MNIEPTPIRDIYVITPNVHEDERGLLMETYRADIFAKVGITDVFVQDNHSRSRVRNTVRGLHFQWDPPAAKLMRVSNGSAFLVAVDIRKKSPTLGQWIGIEASAENKKQLYAPAGCARGYQTLTDDCEVQYKISAFYNSQGLGEIAWDDPDVAVDWPIKEQPFLSARTQKGSSFQNWLKDSRSESFL